MITEPKSEQYVQAKMAEVKTRLHNGFGIDLDKFNPNRYLVEFRIEPQLLDMPIEYENVYGKMLSCFTHSRVGTRDYIFNFFGYTLTGDELELKHLDNSIDFHDEHGTISPITEPEEYSTVSTPVLLTLIKNHFPRLIAEGMSDKMIEMVLDLLSPYESPESIVKSELEKRLGIKWEEIPNIDRNEMYPDPTYNNGGTLGNYISFNGSVNGKRFSSIIKIYTSMNTRIRNVYANMSGVIRKVESIKPIVLFVDKENVNSEDKIMYSQAVLKYHLDELLANGYTPQDIVKMFELLEINREARATES